MQCAVGFEETGASLDAVELLGELGGVVRLEAGDQGSTPITW